MALPIILANLAVPLIGVVDTAVMGRMPTPAYVGATAIGAVIFSSIYWLFGFLRMGTGGLVAQAYGQENSTEISLHVIRGLGIAVMTALVLLLLQTPLLLLSLRAFDTSAELAELTTQYYSIRILSAPATLGLYVVVGALVGLQRMRAVFAVQILLTISNLILNLLFFNFSDLQIKGVAIASVVSEYGALLLGLALIKNHVLPSQTDQSSSKWQLMLKNELLDWNKTLQLLKLNFNLLVRTLCLIASYYWLTINSSRLGEVTLAANSIIVQLLHLMAYALDGFSHTAESLGGQAFGRRHRAQFIACLRTSAELACLFALLISVLFSLAGEFLIKSMTNLPQVIEEVNKYFFWVVISPLVGFSSFLLDGIFIGTTHTREMRNCMIISFALFLVCSIILTARFGNHGLWAAYTILMISRSLTLAHYFPKLLQRLH